jgi:choline dehydrogenase-like flavoprotein
MGTSLSNSVVDEYGRSHAHRNLYLVGSSVFVTGSSVNPTLMLAALALRTAAAIHKSL